MKANVNVKRAAAFLAAVIMIGAAGVQAADGVLLADTTVRAYAEEDFDDDSPMIVSEGTCGENLTWTLDNYGTLTISGTGAMWNYYFNEIKWSGSSLVKNVIINNGVTSIGNWAFYNCKLTEVTIPDSVTRIGENAFCNCVDLESITIPESVTGIGNAAFWNTKWLTAKRAEDPLVVVNGMIIEGYTASGDVTVPNGVKSIGEYAFAFNKNITSVTIPGSVTTICFGAFENCTSLESINIPDSVTSIGSGAFLNCQDLRNVTIPASVTEISQKAFGYIKDNKTYTKINDFTIKGHTDTAAEKYAAENNFEFVSLSEINSDINSDINRDGSTDIEDLVLLQKIVAGWKIAEIWDDAPVFSDDEFAYDDGSELDDEIADDGITELLLEEPVLGDLNGDKIADIEDLVLMQKIVAGWKVELDTNK